MIPLFVNGQNLVPNPSFENFDLSRKKINTETLNKDAFFMFDDWKCLCSADLFCSDCPPLLSTDIKGSPPVKFGKAYTGIAFYCSTSSVCGEYIYVQLLSSLEKDTSYLFEAYLYPFRGIKKAIDAFGGVFLDQNELNQLPLEQIKAMKDSGSNACGRHLKYLKPQVRNPKGKLMYAGTDQWYHLKDTFTAKGGEVYMLLGNFEHNKNVKNISLLETSSYYFIDNISLLPLNGRKKDEDAVPVSFSSDQPYRLENTFFATGKAELLPSSFEELNRLSEYLKKKKSYQIEITGHTDNTGNEETNKKLSEARAKAVAVYLITSGIDKRRIIWKGKGSNEPVATNATEAGRQQNRRVEFILKKTK